MVFIPFERPQYTSSTKIDDSELLTILKMAGDALPKFVQLGKLFEQCNRDAILVNINKYLAEHQVVVTERIRRTYTILLAFTLQVQYKQNNNVHSEHCDTFFL